MSTWRWLWSLVVTMDVFSYWKPSVLSSWKLSYFSISVYSRYLPPSINTLWPSDVIWWLRSVLTLDQVMACCLMAPTMLTYQKCSVEFTWEQFHKCSKYQSIHKMSLKITSTCPRANGLRQWLEWMQGQLITKTKADLLPTVPKGT